MERAPDGRVLVVADTCIPINFMLAERLDLLSRHQDYRFVVTEHTRAEVLDPGQLQQLEAAIQADEIEETLVTDPDELAVFAALNIVLGRGEAAAIAVAEKRGWVIATDEKKRTRREIEERLGKGRLLTTPGIILKCILDGTLTGVEADAIKAKLAANRFAMSFASFADLLPTTPAP
jgi:predicted nucleic acid-binding protein